MNKSEIVIKSEDKVVDCIRFISENRLEIVFADGNVIHLMATSPIACFQGGEPGQIFDEQWITRLD